MYLSSLNKVHYYYYYYYYYYSLSRLIKLAKLPASLVVFCLFLSYSIYLSGCNKLLMIIWALPACTPGSYLHHHSVVVCFNFLNLCSITTLCCAIISRHAWKMPCDVRQHVTIIPLMFALKLASENLYVHSLNKVVIMHKRKPFQNA